MKTGEIIRWVVVDPQSGELVLLCDSRAEARRRAAEAHARIAKVVVTK